VARALLKQGGLFAPISREGALVLNNLFLTCACATVFVGTLYPLALEALTAEKISVGPPFFNATFGPLFVPLLLVMPFGPLLGWKRGDLLGAAQRLLAAAFVAAVAIAATFALQHGGPVLAPFGVGLALFVMAGALIDLAERTMILRIPLGAALRRAAGLPRSAWGTAFAHFGIGVTLLGIVVVTAWGAERIAALRPGDRVDIAHYRLSFDGLFNRSGPNYREVVARFTVHRTNGDLLGVMEPSRRTFPARNMATTEAALMRRGVSQIYLSLGDPAADGTVPVRLYFKPLVLLIWLGALIMFVGGGLSLSDRRLRIGAPNGSSKSCRSVSIVADTGMTTLWSVSGRFRSEADIQRAARIYEYAILRCWAALKAFASPPPRPAHANGRSGPGVQHCNQKKPGRKQPPGTLSFVT
jgi:cytochrome c-type biogenesis protein CcmF